MRHHVSNACQISWLMQQAFFPDIHGILQLDFLRLKVKDKSLFSKFLRHPVGPESENLDDSD